MTGWRIPFHRAQPMGRELEYLAQAAAGPHLAGDGPFTRRCSALLEEMLGARALLTTSCTHALELAALLLDLEPGDEVILPSFTFVSVANAFVLRGARPVFADVEPETLNLDPTDVARKVTGRTRAAVAVHYAGVGCAMDELAGLAERCGFTLVEDAAHGLGGAWRGRPLGALAPLAALSFHETKNFTCGEGGALVVNDRRYLARAEILREKGTDRSRFFRGEVDRYTWQDVGSSYLPSELSAAYLLGQLEARSAIQERRRILWHRYRDGLAGWAARTGTALPCVPPEATPAYHIFHLLLPAPEARAGLIDRLKERGILAVFHYLPLHLAPVGRGFGGRPGDLPVTEAAAERLLRLPLYPGLTDAEQEEVLAAVEGFAA